MTAIPQCHPNRLYGARDLCKVCYNKWLRHNSVTYKRCCKNSVRRWRRTPTGRKSINASCLKKRYGMSVQDYEMLLTKQNGVCAICETSPTKGGLYVDHDHSTGKVRGLLCPKCNTMLFAIEHPEYYERALSYLDRYVSELVRPEVRREADGVQYDLPFDGPDGGQQNVPMRNTTTAETDVTWTSSRLSYGLGTNNTNTSTGRE